MATVLSLSVGESGDTALEGTDYATVGSLTLTIGASQTTATTGSSSIRRTTIWTRATRV